jgi:hypothetical protein
MQSDACRVMPAKVGAGHTSCQKPQACRSWLAPTRAGRSSRASRITCAGRRRRSEATVAGAVGGPVGRGGDLCELSDVDRVVLLALQEKGSSVTTKERQRHEARPGLSEPGREGARAGAHGGVWDTGGAGEGEREYLNALPEESSYAVRIHSQVRVNLRHERLPRPAAISARVRRARRCAVRRLGGAAARKRQGKKRHSCFAGSRFTQTKGQLPRTGAGAAASHRRGGARTVNSS